MTFPTAEKSELCCTSSVTRQSITDARYRYLSVLAGTDSVNLQNCVSRGGCWLNREPSTMPGLRDHVVGPPSELPDMCGRNSLFIGQADLEARFDAEVVTDGGYTPDTILRLATK